MSHSPEPWTFANYDNFRDNGTKYRPLKDADGNEIAGEYPLDGDDLDRAIACVNACQHLTTEWLESHAIVYDEEAGITDIPKE